MLKSDLGPQAHKNVWSEVILSVALRKIQCVTIIAMSLIIKNACKSLNTKYKCVRDFTT